MESKKTHSSIQANSKKELMRKLFAVLTLAAMIAFFSLASKNFLTFKNVVTILQSCSITGLLALGMTFTIVAGGYDLSMGTVLSATGVILANAIVNWGFSVPVAILFTIVVGAAFGLANGLLISKMKLQPFIATLGIMMVAKGLAVIISKATVIYIDGYGGFSQLAGGSVLESLIGLKIPNSILIFLVFAVIGSLILKKSIFGRYIFAIGSNEEASRMSGLNTDNWMTLVYVTAGIFSALGGIMMTSRLDSAQPAIGSGYEMDAIAAVVLGGTPLGGGEGSIWGTVLGVLVMGVLLNGLRMLSVKQEWQTIITGVIIILAVYVDQRRRTKKD